MPIPIGAIDAAYVARLLANSPTLVTPSIASFINAQHNHQSAAGGGSLDASAIGSGTLNNSRVNWAAPAALGSTTPNTSVFTAESLLSVNGAAPGTIASSLANFNGAIQVDSAPTDFSAGKTGFNLAMEFTSSSSIANTMRALNFVIQVDGTGGANPGIAGIIGDARNNQSTGTVASATGASLNVRNLNAGVLTNAVGVQNIFIVSGAGNIATAKDFAARAPSLGSTGVISTHYGYYAENLANASIPTSYAFYAADQSPNTNYALFTGAGLVQHGDQLFVIGSTASRIQTMVRGAASQSVDVFQVQISPNTVVFNVDKNGNSIHGVAGANTAKLNVNADASGVGAIIRENATTPGDAFEVQNSTGAVISKFDSTGALTVAVRDSATATIVDGLIISHDTSGTPAGNSSFGSDIRFQGQSTTTADRDMARIRTYWTDSTDATRTSNLVFSVQNSAAEKDILKLTPSQAVLNAALSLANNIAIFVTNATNSVYNGLVLNSSNQLILGDVNNSGQMLIYGGGHLAFNIFGTNILISDGENLNFGTTTGSQIGTAGGASGQKMAFWGKTPIVQPVLATGASHTVDDVITVLQNLGLVRQS